MGDMADLYDYFMDDEWDDYADEVDDCSALNRKPRIITCKYCGETGFHWQDTPNGWRLFNSEGMHACKGKKDGKQNSSESSP
jgi:hypothetical protein